jgi:hypothetical protein
VADDKASPRGSVELSLGYYGAVRMHLEPVVLLSPEKKSQKVDAVQTTVTLKGTHKNVINKIPCHLSWVIATDRVNKTISHPRDTVVEPKGGNRYEVREVGAKKGETKDLEIDAFELGLAGKGTLNYRLKLDLPHTDPIPPEGNLAGVDSGITVELGADVFFTETSVPTAEGAAAAPPPAPKTKLEDMLVGKPYTVTAKLAEGWHACKDCKAKLHLATYLGEDLHEIPGTAHELEWKTASDAQGSDHDGLWVYQSPTPWRVGTREVDAQTSVLTYHAASPAGNQHPVGWCLTFSRPDPADSKKEQTLTLPVQPAGGFPHPTLTELTLALVEPQVPSEQPQPSSEPQEGGQTETGAQGSTQEAPKELLLSGTFAGFDPSYRFQVTVELLGKFSSAPPDDGPDKHPFRFDVLAPYHELLTRIFLLRPDAGLMASQVHAVPRITRSAEVDEKGRFLVALLAPDEVALSGLRGFEDLALFATVQFPTSVTGSQAAVVFESVASSGFVAMRDGKLVYPFLGLEVCSNLMSLTGRAGWLTPDYDSIDVLTLAACIWTEARDNDDEAIRKREMRHVGGVIMNRFNADQKFSKTTSILKVVLQPRQFSYFNDDSDLKRALQTGSPEAVERWAANLGKGVDHDRFEDECKEIAKDLFSHPAANPWDGDPEVQHYLSPVSLKDVPKWATDFTPNPKATKVPVKGISDDRFRFFRGILREKTK